MLSCFIWNCLPSQADDLKRKRSREGTPPAGKKISSAAKVYFLMVEYQRRLQ